MFFDASELRLDDAKSTLDRTSCLETLDVDADIFDDVTDRPDAFDDVDEMLELTVLAWLLLLLLLLLCFKMLLLLLMLWLMMHGGEPMPEWDSHCSLCAR